MSNKIPVTDHTGVVYPSRSAMLKHYNISHTAYMYRINTLGWSQEKALTEPKDSLHTTAIPCQDHLGQTFTSKVEMCEHWGIPRVMFFRRQRNGWDLEKSLTTPPQRTNNPKGIIDPNGVKFATINEMCMHWGIPVEQYKQNIRNNYSLIDALTKESTEPKCIDHLGTVYPSINELCRAYGITKTTLRCRIELGWTLEQILTNPDKNNHHIKITDHNGKKFDTQKAMLDYYGINYTKFKHRQKIGCDMEHCLQSESLHTVKLSDPYGHNFDTIMDFCSYWHMHESTYHSRKEKYGDDFEKLVHLTKAAFKTFVPTVKIIKHVRNNFYEIKINSTTLIWSLNQLCDYDLQAKMAITLNSNNNNTQHERI